MTESNVPTALRAAGPAIQRGEGNPELRAAIAAFREWSTQSLRELPLTVASPKGSQTKSSQAKELSWLLNAILLDLDWDGGHVSRNIYGSRLDKMDTTALLAALDSGDAPKLTVGPGRPDLVPGHPDLLLRQPSAENMARLIGDWSATWQRPIVADTHPGGTEVGLGAVGAADLVLVPVILGFGELDALQEALRNDYVNARVLIVITKAPKSLALPQADARRLLKLATTYGVDVADTIVRNAKWLTNRQVRGVICAQNYLSPEQSEYAGDMLALAREVIARVAAA